MAIPGIPHGITDDEFIIAFERCGGILEQAAAELGVTTKCIHDHMRKNPSVREELNQIRRRYQYRMLDRAEKVLNDSMDQEEDPNLAFRSSVYVLNNLGRDRGYSHPEVSKVLEERSLADNFVAAGAKVSVCDDGKNLSIETKTP